jgi:hypothetical protein
VTANGLPRNPFAINALCRKTRSGYIGGGFTRRSFRRVDRLGPSLLRRLPQGVGFGFIPFMGFKAEAVRFTGEPREFRSKAANGGDAVRNRCANRMSRCSEVKLGNTDSYTLYAGSLDDFSAFHPTIAIFAEQSGLGPHPARLQGFRPDAGLGIEIRSL